MQNAGGALREPHDEPWHGISSPAAREVVEAVSRRLSSEAIEHYSYPVSASDDRRRELRRQLEQSGLAQRIAGGADMLPAIEDYMPALLRVLFNRTYRRSPGTLAAHVMEHLHWYLHPPRRVVLRELSMLNPPRSSLIFLLGSILLGALAIFDQDLSASFAGGALLLMLAWIICGLEYTGQVQDHDIRCAEFYRYLVETYRDAPEGTGGTALMAGQVPDGADGAGRQGVPAEHPQPAESAWHGIADPVAGRVVEAVMHALPTDAAAIPPAGDTPDDQYRLEIRSRLKHSGLAQRIVAGPEALPWVHDYFTHWARAFTEPARPRSPEQLAVQVMRHLEWYLAPPQLMRPDLRERTRACLIALVAAGLAALGLMVVWIAWFGALTLPSKLVLCAFAALTVWMVVRQRTGIVAADTRHDIRCAEFYRYLIETYRDAPEDGR